MIQCGPISSCTWCCEFHAQQDEKQKRDAEAVSNYRAAEIRRQDRLLGHGCASADSCGTLRTFAAWEAEVARLGKHYDPNADTAVKDALGLAGEVGEVVELIKKDRFQSQPLDRDKLCLELGDVLWYLTNMAAGFGLTLEQIANANRDKLRKRYPTTFTPGGGVR